MNKKIIESNAITDVRNTDSFSQIAQKAQEQPGQYGSKKEIVEKIRKISKEYCDYIEEIKTIVTSKTEKDEQGNYLYEQMDKGDLVDRLFFNGERTSKEGEEFLDKIKNYPFEIKKIAGSKLP